ncbi:MAG: AgmX/PglI C-terminal domain-containing protein [Myxococcales bacterium]|nr:AgmX/PglI C-terminal domain-containing protein [Myxococcales bacterium]
MHRRLLLAALLLGACAKDAEVVAATPPPPPPQPVSEPAPASVQPLEGEARDEAIKGVVRRYSGQMAVCYERRLKVDAAVAGRVELGWMVDRGKVVGSPHIVSNGSGDDALAACLVKNIQRWSFPMDIVGEIVWPFSFRRQ